MSVGIVPPMPPFVNDQEGPFPDVPMGNINYADNNFHGSPHHDNFNNDRHWNPYDGDSDSKQKKNKKNKGTQQRGGPPVDIHYEGYLLEKADPYPGEKATWSRVGKRSMLLGEERLRQLIKAHRLKTRQSPQKDLAQLHSNQSGTINLLIAQRQEEERQKNAEWILADVQCYYKETGLFSKKEVKKIQVILKRQEKPQIKDKDKEKDKLYRPESKSYNHAEILDLDEPQTKPKNKKNKKARSFEHLDHFNDGGPHGLGIGNNNFQPPPIPMPHNQGGYPMQNDNFIPPPPQNVQMNSPYDPQNGAFPPPPPFARHQSMREPLFQNQNPFLANPDIAHPAQYNESHSLDDDWQYSPREGEQKRRRSQSQPRRSSMRRKSRDAGKFDRLEAKVDNLTSLFHGQAISDGSSQGSYEDDSMWSRDGGRGFSDASAPTRYSGRGSLERTKSGPRSRYRSHRYSDADVEPAYSHYGERRQSRHSRRMSGRPNVLHRSETYDDYPMGRGAEPRYAPQPMRRLTYYDDPHDDYDDGRRGGGGGGRYDRFQEGYEAAHEDFAREAWEKRMRRRQSAGVYR